MTDVRSPVTGRIQYVYTQFSIILHQYCTIEFYQGAVPRSIHSAIVKVITVIGSSYLFYLFPYIHNRATLCYYFNIKYARVFQNHFIVCAVNSNFLTSTTDSTPPTSAKRGNYYNGLNRSNIR